MNHMPRDLPATLPPVTSPADVAIYLDPPTPHHTQGRLFDAESTPYSGDELLAPFIAVRDRFSALGFTVRTGDALPASPDGRRNLLISYGMSERHISHSVRKYESLAKRPDVVMSAFFGLECPIVEPGMYEAMPRLARRFARVMSWSDTASLLQFTHEPVPFERFFWPQSFDRVHEALWSNRERGFLLMMNTNKLPRLYVDELYTARLKAVRYFAQFGEVDLYGRYWNQAPRRVGKTRTPATFRRWMEKAWEARQRLWPNPLYTAAAAANRGTANSKSEMFSKYRFALCFENSVLKGWITEKLFDCFFAGTVPVYWGAPDVLDHVPEECFIDMRRFKDFAELRTFLHALSPAEEQRYRDAARAYLESERFTPFRIETWVKIHEQIVTADAGLAL